MNSKWNSLLAPISDVLPCGEDLSFSMEYDRIQEARREDDPTVDYGDWQTTLKQADWPAVVADCTELLQTRSKDLRVVAWLAEGLVKTEGLKGFADGVEMTAGIVERFGSQMHPQAEDGDNEQRIGAISWYIVRMSQLVRLIPLTECKVGRFSLTDFEAARQLQGRLQRHAEDPDNGDQRVTLEKISVAVGKTEMTLYVSWLDEVNRCYRGTQDLIRACDVHFGDDTPSFSQLVENIETVRQRLQAIARDRGLIETAAQQVQGELMTDTQDSTEDSSRGGPITSRTHALECLRQVAVFFRNTEPHSPVAYLAEKAVQWGSMPLHSWLRSVVKDHGTLSHLEEMLGLDMADKSGHMED